MGITTTIAICQRAYLESLVLVRIKVVLHHFVFEALLGENSKAPSVWTPSDDIIEFLFLCITKNDMEL